jgi:hypothetical protein
LYLIRKDLLFDSVFLPLEIQLSHEGGLGSH